MSDIVDLISNEPHGREGQAFAWQSPDAIVLSPLLPALHAAESGVLAGLRENLGINFSLKAPFNRI